MDESQGVERRIREVIAGSTVPEDPDHSRNTLEWLLELEPEADAALRIAALGHDIDRAVEERKVQRADFADYDAFKAAHARNGAAILREILRECGVGDTVSPTSMSTSPSISSATAGKRRTGAVCGATVGSPSGRG
jgi:hypothetical protein